MLVLNRTDKKISAQKAPNTKISFQSVKHINSVHPGIYMDKDDCINQFLVNSFWSGRSKGTLLTQERNYMEYPELGYKHSGCDGRYSMFISKIRWGFPTDKVAHYGDTKTPILDIIFGGIKNSRKELSPKPFHFFKAVLTIKDFLSIFATGVNMVKDPNSYPGEKFHSVQMHSLLLEPTPIDTYPIFMANLFHKRATNGEIPRVAVHGLSCLLHVMELARY